MGERAVQILLVGHCLPDAYAMEAALTRFAPGARFVHVNDAAALARHPDAAALLINRVLDGGFEHSSGIELIRSLPEGARGRAVLISNLPGAQSEAVAAGAARGFGKSELYSDRARSAIVSLLGL